MQLVTLKEAEVIDENEVVVVIDFDGNTDKLLFKGYFEQMPTELLKHEVTISALSKDRVEKFGPALGIFINEWLEEA